ncbi:MAG TPA: ketopantoate reductase family protein [Gaiellaceae bacterium]|nr:ketopantoate reductase family protein [Gaiellaceae bacterium]
MTERVCIVGAGVIGSLFAGHLASVCEVCVLTRRREHADALNEHGLRVSGKSEHHARVTATDDPDALPPFDVAIVATKAAGLQSAVRQLEGRFAEATIVTVLNGIGAEEVVRVHGDWPIVSGVTFMSGTRHSDTHVEYILDTETWLGPYEDTPFEVVRDIADTIAEAGLKVEALPDLRPAQWSKLIFNAAVNPTAALTGLPHEFHFAQEAEPGDLGHLVHGLVDEGKAVAAAAGIELRDDPWEMNVLATRRGSAHYPSMLEDVQSRRETEIDLITGSLVREAGRHDVPVPLSRAVYALVKGREASWRDENRTEGGME